MNDIRMEWEMYKQIVSSFIFLVVVLASLSLISVYPFYLFLTSQGLKETC